MDEIDYNRLPRHIAIIMDGNGRWAKARNLPVSEGHKAGINALKNVIEACRKFGIKYVTVFAFSTENWKRPKEEIDLLFGYIRDFIKTETQNLIKNKVRLILSGTLKNIPTDLAKEIRKSIYLTRNNNNYFLNIAFNYGARLEILEAVRKILRDSKKKRIKLSPDVFSSYLYTKDLPDPDLLIRTSGEQRISNFLLWQIAYTELYFPKVYWPDFDEVELKKAIIEYQKRERRFGARI